MEQKQRLIDGNKASAVLQNIKNSLYDTPANPVDMRAVLLAVVDIINAQTAIDPVYAAGACYCRECAHSKFEEYYPYCDHPCGGHPRVIDPNDFCNYGKRKEIT